MIYIISFIISTFLGITIITSVFPKKQQMPFLLKLPLAYGLGFGISALIAFFSLIIFNQINPSFIYGFHGLLYVGLNGWHYKKLSVLFSHTPLNRNDLIVLLMLTLFLIPLFLFANLYPLGGWDAWSCWNLKARFIFLGGDQWQRMFDPLLWRSNIGYPFLLPLINTWSWLPGKQPHSFIPLTHSVLFTWFTGIILWQGFQIQRRQWSNLLPSALFLSLFLFIQLSASQYVDILISYYLLASLVCFVLGHQQKQRGYFILQGLIMGLMSFTKNEGLAMAAVISCLSGLIMLGRDHRRHIPMIILGLSLTILPTFLFRLVYQSEQTAFINGFISTESPATLTRLLIIGVYFIRELIAMSWHGLWIMLGALGLYYYRHVWRMPWCIIPLALAGYLAIVVGYYWINTFFEIKWWLGVTLNRILFTLLPTAWWGIWGATLTHPKKSSAGIDSENIVHPSST